MSTLNVNIPATFEETVTAPHITGLETPTQPTDAANKQYVDNAVSGGGGGDYLPLAGGEMNADARIIIPSSINGATTTITGMNIAFNSPETQVRCDYGGISIQDGNANIALNSGGLTLGNTGIYEVATPVNDTDGANKKYVDDAVAGGGGVTFLGEGGTNTAHFYAFDLGGAVMLVGRFLNASFGASTEFTVGIDLGVSPSSFNKMIPITYYNNTATESSGTILTLSGSGLNTVLTCTSNTKSYNGSGCFTAIFVK